MVKHHCCRFLLLVGGMCIIAPPTYYVLLDLLAPILLALANVSLVAELSHLLSL